MGNSSSRYECSDNYYYARTGFIFNLYSVHNQKTTETLNTVADQILEEDGEEEEDPVPIRTISLVTLV